MLLNERSIQPVVPMKKVIIIIILVIMVVALLVFMKKQSNQDVLENQAPTSPTTVNLFHYFSGVLSGGIDEMVHSVNQRTNDYDVNARPLDHEAYKTMILSTLSKGNSPELFSYWAGAKTQALVDDNLIEPLDDLFQDPKIAKRFSSPVASAASSYDGTKFLIPLTQHYVGIFYNKRILEKEELKEPTSWQELLSLAERLKTLGYYPFGIGAKERWPAQFWFDYLLLRTAGPEYRRRLMVGDADYTDEEVVRAYTIWADLVMQNYFNEDANELDWHEASKLLCDEKAVMTLMGTWIIPLLASSECGLSEEGGIGFSPFPDIDSGVTRAALGPVDGLVLAAGSTQKEYAKTVLRYFSEIEPQKSLSSGSGAFAPSSEIEVEFYSPLKQQIMREIAKANHWSFNYDLATETEIAEKGMDSFNELLAFPDQVGEILQNLQEEVERIRAQIKGSKK